MFLKLQIPRHFVPRVGLAKEVEMQGEEGIGVLSPENEGGNHQSEQVDAEGFPGAPGALWGAHFSAFSLCSMKTVCACQHTANSLCPRHTIVPRSNAEGYCVPRGGGGTIRVRHVSLV